MIPRYANKDLDRIWSDENKFLLWQRTELAVIQARANLGIISRDVYDLISRTLLTEPIDVEWIAAREKETNHDLNAFLDERLRHLPVGLQKYLHDGMTSYDTEEPAFAKMLNDSLLEIYGLYNVLWPIIAQLATRHRFTVMNGRTHGQEAELQSFGKRCLTWYQSLKISLDRVRAAQNNLFFSKLSGAIGNYRGITPELEEEALRLMELKPFYGATQIMPRQLYVSVADALSGFAMSLHKIALDIRLGARSGRPILQEPFGKKQKGSSAMPHKKNTIATEQMEGMAHLAEGYCQSIHTTIPTWEERSIEQSCIERTAWPDLFHVVAHMLKTMTRVLSGLTVYPDNMLLEIVDSRGCYAAGEAKEFLRQRGAEYGLSAEDAYRIVQLAAFNAFEPTQWQTNMREIPCGSLDDADTLLDNAKKDPRNDQKSIQKTIPTGLLHPSPQLGADEKTIRRWIGILNQIFSTASTLNAWDQIFDPSYLLKGESRLFEEILGI